MGRRDRTQGEGEERRRKKEGEEGTGKRERGGRRNRTEG